MRRPGELIEPVGVRLAVGRGRVQAKERVRDGFRLGLHDDDLAGVLRLLVGFAVPARGHQQREVKQSLSLRGVQHLVDRIGRERDACGIHPLHRANHRQALRLCLDRPHKAGDDRGRVGHLCRCHAAQRAKRHYIAQVPAQRGVHEPVLEQILGREKELAPARIVAQVVGLHDQGPVAAGRVLRCHHLEQHAVGAAGGHALELAHISYILYALELAVRTCRDSGKGAVARRHRTGRHAAQAEHQRQYQKESCSQ